MFLFHTIDLKCALCIFNDPTTIKKCYNKSIIANYKKFSIVSTRDTVPGVHFGPNMNGITKIKFLDKLFICNS